MAQLKSGPDPNTAPLDRPDSWCTPKLCNVLRKVLGKVSEYWYPGIFECYLQLIYIAPQLPVLDFSSRCIVMCRLSEKKIYFKNLQNNKTSKTVKSFWMHYTRMDVHPHICSIFYFCSTLMHAHMPVFLIYISYLHANIYTYNIIK